MNMRQIATMISPTLDPEVAARLAGGMPQIRVPVAPTLAQRIGALAKRLMELERQIADLRTEDRDQWEETSTDLDALLHEAEHSAGVLDRKLNGDARDEEAQRAQAEWDETERGLRTFGLSIK